jgi:hypothetical protein
MRLSQARRCGRFSSIVCATLTVLLSLCGRPAAADDLPSARATAPPDYVELKSTPAGGYFVAQSLKADYDKQLAKVNALRSQIANGEIRGKEALEELRGVQTELDRLRAEIERGKVFVSPATIHTRSDATTFELGPERLLVITGDNIRLQGWEGPGVKCVLEKTVYSADDKPVDEQFDGIRVVHKQERQPKLVGKTPEEYAADDEAFLASPKAQNLTDAQRAGRAALMREISESWSSFRPFQDKEIDSLEIEGLTHEQGNRQLMLEIGAGAEAVVTRFSTGRRVWSQWQRHASLTVLVPPSVAIALKGCLVKLDVTGVDAALLVSNQGSRDRDYDGSFQIKDLRGDLTVENVPLDRLEKIVGNVSLNETVDFANSASERGPDGLRMYNPPPRTCQCRGIEGNFTAWVSRMNLDLAGITGRIDVRNEFGDTHLALTEAPVAEPQRIVSEAGRIEVDFEKPLPDGFRLFALTSAGTVEADNDGQLLFDELNFTTGYDPKLGSRNWRGVKSKRESASPFEDRKRETLALEGLDRPAGLDLISRGGKVVLRLPK